MLYIDFDGTLTTLSGQQTIDLEIYHKLIQKWANGANKLGSHETKFKPHAECVNLLKQILRHPNNHLRMTINALSFLQWMLEQEIEVIIISRNRREFINAMLNAQSEMDKITLNEKQIIIKDRMDLMDNLFFKNKGNIIEEWENNHANVSFTIICDDDPKDFKEMTEMVVTKNNLTTPIFILAKSGEFDFAAIKQKIENALMS